MLLRWSYLKNEILAPVVVRIVNEGLGRKLSVADVLETPDEAAAAQDGHGRSLHGRNKQRPKEDLKNRQLSITRAAAVAKRECTRLVNWRSWVRIPPGAGLFPSYFFLLSFTRGVSLIRSLKRRCISNCVLRKKYN